jgi:hypothetical protein
MNNFGVVQSIALLCTDIDNSWHQSITGVLDKEQQTKAVAECAHKLEQMSQPVIRCAGIIFENVQRGREESKSGANTRVEIHHKNSMKFRQAPESFAPADEGVARFSILYGRSIWPIRLDPNSDNMLILDASEDLSASWNISLQQVDAMTQTMWDGCLVTAAGSLMEAIPIPRLRSS